MSDDTRAASDANADDCATDALAAFLRRAEITECKLVPWGSNYTFAVALEDPDGEFDPALGIYKPRAGEVPLWDFPDGTLYQREYAAYVVTQALGWPFIPTTVVRDGPHGIGTVQEYIEPDPDTHYFNLRGRHTTELRRMALFDLIANNADRKAGHCFTGLHDRKLWGIDHGLTFNVQPKLRTVIWEFVGDPIPDDLRAALRRISCDAALAARLRVYLDPLEVHAFQARAARLADVGVFPELNPRRNVPYGW
jgi:uncharacterized repeat protein (TIGR03843 family)